MTAENPNYPVASWQQAVAEGLTLLGYEKWAKQCDTQLVHPLGVDCPACGQCAGYVCRTFFDENPTAPHAARYYGAEKKRAEIDAKRL